MVSNQGRKPGRPPGSGKKQQGQQGQQGQGRALLPGEQRPKRQYTRRQNSQGQQQTERASLTIFTKQGAKDIYVEKAPSEGFLQHHITFDTEVAKFVFITSLVPSMTVHVPQSSQLSVIPGIKVIGMEEQQPQAATAVASGKK
jgi:hypothetical protein